MIITIVGGGSTFTPGIVKSIAQRRFELELTEIRLFDIDKKRQDKIGVLVEWILREELKCDIKLVVTNDEQTAYKDSSFIFAQMRVGKYAMRELDEKIPLKYGCVGQETCGPGGFAYGLRTINPMIKMIDDVELYAKKDYWILNYSNPASIVSEACKKLRPNTRIINICDMPIAIIDMIAESLNIKDKKNISYDYYGLNHFGWFTSIEYKGRNIMSEISSYIKQNKVLLPQKYLDAIKKREASEDRHATSSWLHVWKGVYEMMEYFPSVLPNTYMNYYLQSKETVEHSNPNYTRANEVMDSREKELFAGIDHYIETGEIDPKVFYAGSHGDWISDLAVAIKNNTRARFLVITENKGAIANMPYDAMVEVLAYIGKNGPEVVRCGNIPLFHQGLMMQQLNSEKLLVEGCIENSYEKVLQAFTLNKTIPSMKVAKALLDELIIANKDYWPILK